jgi:FkbH-like protein
VIGDDGVDGIALGHLGDGEAFVDFQHFILELKKRGIILAVCSKNEESNAKIPFLEHPEMVLKLEDIAIFVANWDNKADNIKVIKESLNIGYDSIVFLDDNPYERNLVRKFLPDVIVPELPEDPALYVRHISELNLFETSSYTDEDKTRSEMYKVEFERQKLQKKI